METLNDFIKRGETAVLVKLDRYPDGSIVARWSENVCWVAEDED
jgi:hypothetical protein